MQRSVETLHHKGFANRASGMSIRDNTPSDVLYTEAGMCPLHSEVLARQLKFWNSLVQDMTGNSEAPIFRLLCETMRPNIPFVAHYVIARQLRSIF